ncbi:hypothetical protein LO763_01265 [Glycomyces sp. A-F 0318]|uniref:hypothetical protein n=1 Tax=Glycomyces amatae TaxID=2881355 RepID=UPI001E291F7A|nr:hypothetical protein [Glycomyces amatae]MCD0442254.1 hypothetical protein [Glycomyces amatae]
MPDYDAVKSGREAHNLNRPTELFVDAVRVFCQGETPQLAAVVEMQHREVEKKLFDWPHFLFAARVEHGCPTILVVLTVSVKTAEWARRPIDGGLGQSLVRPVVICLEELEPDSDIGVSILRAFTDNVTENDLRQLSAALADLPADLARQYAGIVSTGLQGTENFTTWRDLMALEDYVYQNDYARELIAKGELKGKAISILQVLAARDIEVPERVRKKILACQDQAQLEHWLAQAAVTDDIVRLFSE